MLKIETPQDDASRREFIAFYERVYASRSAYWKPAARFEMAVLRGESAFNEARTMRPFVARERGKSLRGYWQLWIRVISVIGKSN